MLKIELSALCAMNGILQYLWERNKSAKLTGMARMMAVNMPTARHNYRVTSTGSLYQNHRRRTKTEEKAKVVSSVWGKEFIKSLAALAVLSLNSIFFHSLSPPANYWVGRYINYEKCE